MYRAMRRQDRCLLEVEAKKIAKGISWRDTNVYVW